jgi:hypothetical protein
MSHLYFKDKKIGEFRRDKSGLVLVMNNVDCFGALMGLTDEDVLQVGQKRIRFPLFVKSYMARTAAFYTSPENYRKYTKTAV